MTCLTECLAAQLESEETKFRAGIFYPSGGLLKTGLWTADRNRPAELAHEKPRPTPAMTIETLEKMAKDAGRELPFQDLDELAQMVVAGIKEDRFVMMLGIESIGTQMRERAGRAGTGRPPRCAPIRLVVSRTRRRRVSDSARRSRAGLPRTTGAGAGSRGALASALVMMRCAPFSLRSASTVSPREMLATRGFTFQLE